MKKYFILIILLTMFAVPVFAICSLSDSVCSSSVLAPPKLQDKYVPNYLNEYQKPDAFLPQYRQPYYDMLINTEVEPVQNNDNTSYNANCQFGVCIPSSGVTEEEP